jgi:hypothetical protein
MVVLHNNANRDFMHLIWKIYYYELVTGKEKDIHVSHKGQGVATNREKGQGVTRTRVGAAPNKNGLARTLPILQFSLLWNLIWVFIYTKLKLRFVCIILVMCLWFLTDSVHKYRCGTFMTVTTTGSVILFFSSSIKQWRGHDDRPIKWRTSNRLCTTGTTNRKF